MLPSRRCIDDRLRLSETWRCPVSLSRKRQNFIFAIPPGPPYHRHCYPPWAIKGDDPMNRMNRRRFVQTSAAAAGFFLTAGVTESGARRQDNPMDRLNIAVIGCGGQGAGDTGNVSRENIVALCDPDQNRARGTFEKYAKVPKYDDFRVMLEKQKDIEAVVVATPDHTHAMASCLAMSMGK